MPSPAPSGLAVYTGTRFPQWRGSLFSGGLVSMDIRRIAVDVHGEPVEESRGDPPQRGWDAVLTLDAAVQVAAEDALDRAVKLARGLTDPESGKKYRAPAGAVVALDPRSGEVLAFTKPLSASKVLKDRKKLAKMIEKSLKKLPAAAPEAR